MFESLKVEESLTTTVVSAQLSGNPFTIKGVVGTVDGKFKGISFIEVYRNFRAIPTGIYCADYGVVHSYTGEDADKLNELVTQFNIDIQEKFGITFLVSEPPVPMEEPVPPQEEE